MLYQAVRKLADADADALAAFDCADAPLNQFLQRFALASQKAHGAQTYVCVGAGAVLGYYSLVVGSVEHMSVSARVRKGMAPAPSAGDDIGAPCR